MSNEQASGRNGPGHSEAAVAKAGRREAWASGEQGCPAPPLRLGNRVSLEPSFLPGETADRWARGLDPTVTLQLPSSVGSNNGLLFLKAVSFLQHKSPVMPGFKGICFAPSSTAARPGVWLSCGRAAWGEARIPGPRVIVWNAGPSPALCAKLLATFKPGY